MGSSKSVTVGYRYGMGLHMGLCHGPVDAFLEIIAGGRSAWHGEVTTNEQVLVHVPNLWGGDEREGGLSGWVDVMMGGPSQAAHSYLAAMQGTPQPAYRGLLSLVYRGIVASNNPYLKPWALRVRRITAGWEGGTAWNPTKAAIAITPVVPFTQDGWRYQVEAPGSTADYSAADYDDSAWPTGPGGFGNLGVPGTPLTVGTFVPSGVHGRGIWLRREVALGASQPLRVDVYQDDGAWLWWNGEAIPLTSTENYYHSYADIPSYKVFATNVVALKVLDGIPGGSPVGIYAGLTVGTTGVLGMNPAHIVMECLTNTDWGMGEPMSSLDLPSFTAAAETFYTEGLGLCLQWTRQDSIENFVQLVINHAGAVLVQDRATGLFKLKPMRADYDLDTVPAFSDALGNVLELESFDRADDSSAVNELTVVYTESTSGKETPVTVQNLAAIQSQGGINSETRNYPGLPSASLAQRTALRDLRAASGLARVKLVVNRDGWNLLPGDVVKFSWAPLGIEAMALRIGRVNYGDLKDGRVRIEAAEDVFGLPLTTYVGTQPPGWQEPDTSPRPSAAVAAFEAPYRELVQTIGRAETQALPTDTGYLAMAAIRPPGVSLNYELYARTGADPYASVGAGDWCPTGLLSAAITATTTAITLTSPSDLADVVVGTTVMIGESPRTAEIGRVDAINALTGAVTIARGCLDTTPKPWPLGTRLYFYDLYSAAGSIEYVDDEVVSAKAVTRSPMGLMDVSLAPTDASVTMDSRAARPYPPGDLKLNGVRYPTGTVVGTITATWAHRDRIVEDDQVVDTLAASIGPEPGVTYSVQFFLNGVLQSTQTGITGTASAGFLMTGVGVGRVEVRAVRGILDSWQVLSHEFSFIPAPQNVRVRVGGDRRITVGGDVRNTIG